MTNRGCINEHVVIVVDINSKVREGKSGGIVVKHAGVLSIFSVLLYRI